MSKRTTFTTVSPLPAGIPREVVVDFLHNHQEMIDLNPLVIERHTIPPPSHAPDEEKRCVWWSITDTIAYIPGVVTRDVTYNAAFNDLPNGIQTHVYAPAGTDIRERWTLNGTLPGEPAEPIELGLNAPRQGLYLREDVDLRCNFMMASFVKKTLKKAHGSLVDRLCQKARAASAKLNPELAVEPPPTLILGDDASATNGHGAVDYLGNVRNGQHGTPSPGPDQESATRPQKQQQQQQAPSHTRMGSAGDGTPSVLRPASHMYQHQRSSSQPGARFGAADYPHQNGAAPQIPPLAELAHDYHHGIQGRNGWATGAAHNGHGHDSYDPFASGWRGTGPGGRSRGNAAELE
ncbi:hypothetical protein F4778DRAFT_751611 [Xylariomycetidae sp. FL2044]|nr:hypothetical protein F4778DRAFT_751611 [Xylariomycetidae sp. FL2044]